MGRRGPQPKPAKLRLLEGARPSKVNHNEPVPSDDLPVCPDWVAPEVRQVWDYTVQELDQMGLASSADRDVLLAFCEQVNTHRRACQMLAKSDVLIKGPLGGPVRNPAVVVQRDSAQAIRSLAQEFGLSPSARARIQVQADHTADHDNPFADTAP
jgi:P27 family predicted phage terminase small subunit